MEGSLSTKLLCQKYFSTCREIYQATNILVLKNLKLYSTSMLIKVLHVGR